MIGRAFFDTSRDGNVPVFALKHNVGSFAESELIAEVGDLIREIDDAHASGIVVDFTRAEYFGSAMLEALRRLWTHLRKSGARMVLCGVSDVGRDIVHVAHFDAVWPMCETRAEAVRLAAGDEDPRD